MRLALVIFLIASATAAWPDLLSDDVKTELKQTTDKLKELLSLEAKPEKLREELEEDTGDSNISASAEVSPVRPGIEDDDDESDEIIPSNFFNNFFNTYSFLNNPALKPWWQRDYVCIEKISDEKDEENDSRASNGFLIYGSMLSSCETFPSKYVCNSVTQKGGKINRVTTTYKCCDGYRRLEGSDCQKIDAKPMDEVVRSLNATKFADLCTKDMIPKEATFFVPTDSAFEASSLLGNALTNEVSDVEFKSNPKDLILNHIVRGFYETAELTNEQVLSNQRNGTLRVNAYPTGVITVNCAVVNSTDVYTENGVVHTIEQVLTVPEKSLTDLLMEPQYSKFLNLLEQNHLSELLLNKVSTVLAIPNDKIDNFDSKYALCLGTILKHHILPGTLCSSAVASMPMMRADADGEPLKLRTEDNEVYADGIKMVKKDIMATNGVLHEVDGFIIPSTARSATDLLTKTNHTKFLELLEKTGLKSIVDKADNLTLFVPTEEALKDLDNFDKADLKKALMYHMGNGKAYSRSLTDADGLHFPTKGGIPLLVTSTSIPSNILQLLSGRANVNVGCAKVTRVDGQICNGVVHEIDRALTLPADSIMDQINAHSQLTHFRDIIKGTGIEEMIKKLESATVLAPADSAFTDTEHLERLKTDKELAKTFVKSHILVQPVCCSEIEPRWPFTVALANLQGAAVYGERRPDGTVAFGHVNTKQCDLTARDGIVHVLDGTLFNPSSSLPAGPVRITRPGSEIILGF